jgi:DNA-binding beta-propeller fold protein YncE
LSTIAPQFTPMRRILYTILGLTLFASCTKMEEENPGIAEISSKRSPLESESFIETQIGSIDLGTTGAAEISAYDPLTKKLFVVNNASTNGVANQRIDVLDLSNPASPALLAPISIASFGNAVNSVSVKNGMLAAAIEAKPAQDPGKVVVFRTSNNVALAEVKVGALPDMVTFSPDGKFILSANEGEPDDDYKNDPEGSVSIIEVENGFAVTTLNFAAFAGQEEALKKKGLRIFGPGASFAQDIEPEYVAVSANSKTAWVSLQENNAIARIDIRSKTIEAILPLGFKDYSVAGNFMDLSDRDNINGNFKSWPVKGMYLPDGLAVHPENGTPFVYTANEGDSRDYDGYSEEFTLNNKPQLLDPTRFPNASDLVKPEQLGRLKLTSSLGDTDGDGDYDELYSFGARSISVWNGNTGQQVFDSGNELDRQWSLKPNFDDGRSDDKGSEPETVVIGRVGNRNLLFVALERADAFAIYDVTNPVKPSFRQWILTGDAPEGILFVPADESPIGKSLVIVSNEGDGTVRIYTTQDLSF